MTQPLQREDILELLTELAERLPPDPHHHIAVAGGAFLALHQYRRATFDIDSLTTLDEGLKSTAAEIGQERNIRHDWLNDTARAFAPDPSTLIPTTTVFSHGPLTVITPPPDAIFIMKLHAARPHDRDDMIDLWPACAFTNAQDAVDRYYDSMPMAFTDPHLTTYVEDIITESNQRFTDETDPTTNT